MNKVNLCWECAKNIEGINELWHILEFDPEKPRKCSKCGLKGIYVREVPVEDKE